MVLTIKHKLVIYRRFEKDIWGYCYTDNRCEYIYNVRPRKYGKTRPLKLNLKGIYKIKSPYLAFFYRLWWIRRHRYYKKRQRYVYRFDAPKIRRKRRKFNRRFISLRLTRLYFLTFQDNQFRRLFKKAVKLDGNFETNYLKFLEGRALAIIYRLNLSSDIFWLLGFVKAGNIYLDFLPIKWINAVIPVGKLITVKKKWHLKFINGLLKRIKLRTLMFPSPTFIFASYSCFFFYLMRYPKRRDLVYPYAIDLQRITGYY